MKQFTGFLKGVNLGGWLSQGEYTKEHLDSFITEENIAEIASWGVDHIRVPVDYNIFETDSGELKEDGIFYVQNVISWCEKYGLNMVLDLHKTFGYSFDKGEKQMGFFDKEELQERFYRLWKRLAEHFGKYSDRVAFELLNEVTDKSYSDIWNKIAAKAVSVVRSVTKDTKILIGSYWNNSIEALEDLDLPADENIVYNVHCYDPFLFTHQGATWVDRMPIDFRIVYPGDAAEYIAKAEELALPFDNHTDDIQAVLDASYFENRFKKAVKICEERGVALYCGEYGVIDRADPEQILSWYKDINSAFEKYGIGRSAWNYKEKDFGLSAERMKPVIGELVKYL